MANLVAVPAITIAAHEAKIQLAKDEVDKTQVELDKAIKVVQEMKENQQQLNEQFAAGTASQQDCNTAFYAVQAAESEERTARFAKSDAKDKYVDLVMSLQERKLAEAQKRAEDAETTAAQATAATNAAAKQQQRNNDKKPSKFSIPVLKGPDGFRNWIYRVSGQLEKARLRQPVTTAVDEPSETAVQAILKHLDDAQRANLTEVGAEIQASLEDQALELRSSRKAEGAVGILKVLNTAYGNDTGIDQVTLLSQFWTQKWDPSKQSLSEFISAKLGAMLRLKDYILEEQRDKHLCACVLTLLPRSFDVFTSGLRAKLPKDMEIGHFAKEIETQLLDFETARKGAKTEEQGKVYLTQAQFKDLKQSGIQNFGDSSSMALYAASQHAVKKGPGGKPKRWCRHCMTKVTTHTEANCNYRPGGSWTQDQRTPDPKGADKGSQKGADKGNYKKGAGRRAKKGGK